MRCKYIYFKVFCVGDFDVRIVFRYSHREKGKLSNGVLGCVTCFLDQVYCVGLDEFQFFFGGQNNFLFEERNNSLWCSLFVRMSLCAYQSPRHEGIWWSVKRRSVY
jgi:hypothetical protein